MQESTVCRGISMEEDEPVFPDGCFPTTPPVTSDLKKHPEPKGCPVGDSSSVGSHPSMLLYPPVPGVLQKDTVTSGNLSNHMIQVPKLYPDSPLSSNAQLETGSQMCEEPSWKSSFHISLSPPVHSEVQMQTRPPHHLSCVSKWSLQGSQSHLFSQEEIRQTRQCVSDLTDLYTPRTPQWTPVPSSPDSRLPIHQDLPTMGVTSSPNHQMLSRSCTSSASEVSSGSTFPPHQVLNAGPRKQRKERTVYTKEQKLLLQEHFKQCMYPSSDRCKELARRVGVTESEIKIWFKNNRARYRLNEKRQPEKF